MRVKPIASRSGGQSSRECAPIRRDAVSYAAHHEVAEQHQRLLDVLRSGDPDDVVAVTDPSMSMPTSETTDDPAS